MEGPTARAAAGPTPARLPWTRRRPCSSPRVSRVIGVVVVRQRDGSSRHTNIVIGLGEICGSNSLALSLLLLVCNTAVNMVVFSEHLQ